MNREEAGGCRDQAEAVPRAASTAVSCSAVQQLRLRPHDGLRGALKEYWLGSTQPNSMTPDTYRMECCRREYSTEYAAAHSNYRNIDGRR